MKLSKKKKKLKTCVFKSAVVLGNSSGSSCNHSTQICLSWEVGSYNTWKIRSLRHSWFIKAVHGSSLSSINPMEFGREGNTVTGEMPVCIFFLYFPLTRSTIVNMREGKMAYLYSCFLHGWLSSIEIKDMKGKKGISSQTFYLYEIGKGFEECAKYTQYFTFFHVI